MVLPQVYVAHEVRQHTHHHLIVVHLLLLVNIPHAHRITKSTILNK